MFDIIKSCDLINCNVGRRVIMKIQKYRTEKIEEIKGIISSAFSNDPTPDCQIDTESGRKEVLLGEIMEMKIV